MGDSSLESQVELTDLKKNLTKMGDFDDKSALTIFCRNLSWNATQEDLFNVPEFKNASDIKIPTDRETGGPRGFCFIEFNTPEECQQALQQAQNVAVDGRELILAQSQPRSEQSGGRGGGGGGGFRGGRGGGRGRGGYGGQQQGGYGGQQQQGGYGGQQGGYNQNGGGQGGW